MVFGKGSQKGYTPPTAFKIGHITWNKSKNTSNETKNKISKSKKGKHFYNATQFKGGHLPWNTGLTRDTDDRLRIIAEMKEGCPRSEESKQKMREAILNLENFKGNKGSRRHQELVEKIATKLNNGINKIEVEKPIKIDLHHWRIIDILVNDTTCYEIGQCEQNKIDDLLEHGFEVIHLPYSILGGI